MKKGISIFLISLMSISSVFYLLYNVMNMENLVNGIGPVISSAIIVFFSIVFTFVFVFLLKEKGKFALSLTSLVITGFCAFNLLIDSGYLTLPSQDTLEDFTNVEITEAMTWASGNNIEIIQTYEYSDTVPEYHIIDQNITVGTLTKEIEKIEFVISLGPNYDKQLIVTSMLGWNIDDIVNYIKENHLINVNINYEVSDVLKDTLISQDKSGTLRRSDEINIVMSLGPKAELSPIELIDFTNMTLFDSTLWLKRNAIDYKLVYEFSDTVKRHNVILQDTDEGTLVSPFDKKVTLTISKGSKIVVPDILSMTIEEVTNWVIDNKLQINFSDAYDDTVNIGSIISSNVKQGDTVEEETIITVVTSKGQLRMEEFASLSDFRNWAAKYNIPYEEDYEFSTEVSSGNVISFSKEKGDVIGNDETISVVVSQGAPVTIPNFYGMSWSSIQSKCNSLGLRCYYKYGDYKTSVSKGYAYYQNRSNGSVVVSGTSVTVTLSKGTPSTWQVELPVACYTTGSYDGAVSCLKSNLAKYSDVTFKYVAKLHNERTSGMPHPDSPLKAYDTIKQGNTYEIWIVK